MNTQNVISTPEITGNIGSCTTQKVEFTSQRFSFWTEEQTTITTNSCTGQVQTYNSWGLTESSVFLFIGLGLMLFVLFVILISMMDI